MRKEKLQCWGKKDGFKQARVSKISISKSSRELEGVDFVDYVGQETFRHLQDIFRVIR